MVRKGRNCKELRSDYDAAFMNWVAEAAALRSGLANPAASPESIEAAKTRANRAQAGYRERRDLLLRKMSGHAKLRCVDTPLLT